MGNQRDKFVYYIVQKYLENLCEFIRIYLDVDVAWCCTGAMPQRGIWSMMLLVVNRSVVQWLFPELVVWLWWCTWGHGFKPSTWKKFFFFSRWPPDIRHEPPPNPVRLPNLTILLPSVYCLRLSFWTLSADVWINPTLWPRGCWDLN